MISRRAFLVGTAAVVAAPVLPAMPLAPKGRAVIYANRTFRTSDDMMFLEGMSQRIARMIIYGNSEETPTQFMGLGPIYSIGSDDDATRSLWRVSWSEKNQGAIAP